MTTLPPALVQEFLREFVNTHNDTWRPLRGLWHEEVLEFMAKVYTAGREDERKAKYIWCEVDGIQELLEDDMGMAIDLMCKKCHLVIATLHKQPTERNSNDPTTD